ncbi:MAG: SMI1/KNR4 family protein [Nitrososphaerales archaeon]
MQIQEIIHNISLKLSRLKSLDKGFEIFGADSHQYKSKKISVADIQIFEKRLSVSLPLDFKEFLINIGSGAGPCYGIFTLEKMLHEYEEWAFDLNPDSKPSTLSEIKNLHAEVLVQKKINYPKEYNYYRLKTANGILPIQTDGCTYYAFIVLNGEQSGKIWNTDTNEFDSLPAGSVQEWHFLEWYDNWLNESLSKFGDISLHQTEISQKKWWQRLFN